MLASILKVIPARLAHEIMTDWETTIQGAICTICLLGAAGEGFSRVMGIYHLMVP